MDNRWKLAVFFGAILLLLIFALMDMDEYTDTEDREEYIKQVKTNLTHAAKDPIIPFQDRNVTLQEFMNMTAVKAFKAIHNTAFTGKWEFQNIGDPIFPHENINTGALKMTFHEDFSEMRRFNLIDSSEATICDIKIIEGDYLDDEMHIIGFGDLVNATFNPTTLQYAVLNKSVLFFNIKKLELQEETVCNVDIRVDFSGVIQLNDTSYNINRDADVPFELTSQNCSFAIKSTLILDWNYEEVQERRAIYYSLILVFIAIANLYSTAKMIRQAIDTPAKASQVSLMTIGLVLIWDSYICISHLFLSLDLEQLFQFLMIPTFWYFILASVFEAKLLLLIWRARYWNLYDNQEQGRRALGYFYLKLHASMIVLIYLFYQYVFENWFILLMSFYLVPQIFHSASQGGRMEFDKNYIFSVVGLRLFIPLYFRGWPYNVLNLRPSYSFCFALLLVIGAQIYVVYLQSIRGAKFFIPARFLPPQYNYLVDITNDDLESGVETDDCAVCMAPLHHETDASAIENANSRIILDILRPNHNQIMKTPCGHKFHVKCLVEWMGIKMECPTCRARLPVIE